MQCRLAVIQPARRRHHHSMLLRQQTDSDCEPCDHVMCVMCDVCDVMRDRLCGRQQRDQMKTLRDTDRRRDQCAK